MLMIMLNLKLKRVMVVGMVASATPSHAPRSICCYLKVVSATQVATLPGRLLVSATLPRVMAAS